VQKTIRGSVSIEISNTHTFSLCVPFNSETLNWTNKYYVFLLVATEAITGGRIR